MNHHILTLLHLTKHTIWVVLLLLRSPVQFYLQKFPGFSQPKITSLFPTKQTNLSVKIKRYLDGVRLCFKCGNVTTSLPFSVGVVSKFVAIHNWSFTCFRNNISLIISNYLYGVFNIDQASNTIRLDRAELQCYIFIHNFASQSFRAFTF